MYVYAYVYAYMYVCACMYVHECMYYYKCLCAYVLNIYSQRQSKYRLNWTIWAIIPKSTSLLIYYCRINNNINI